jgi:hypothetical protein
MKYLPRHMGKRIMAKKSITEQFRDFLDALPAESNKPMTGREIATVRAKKKVKAKRTAKAAAKKAKNPAPKKSAKKSRKKSKR